MKIISLNVWAGRAGREKLIEFFKKYHDTDIFCLQEMWEGGDHRIEYYQRVWTKPEFKIINTLISDAREVLKDHQVFFYPFYEDFYGQAIFIKKGIPISEEGEIFVHKTKEDAWSLEDENHARNMQYITIETPRGLQPSQTFMGFGTDKAKKIPMKDCCNRIIL
jgi:exonuclease III